MISHYATCLPRDGLLDLPGVSDLSKEKGPRPPNRYHLEARKDFIIFTDPRGARHVATTFATKAAAEMVQAASPEIGGRQKKSHKAAGIPHA